MTAKRKTEDAPADPPVLAPAEDAEPDAPAPEAEQLTITDALAEQEISNAQRALAGFRQPGRETTPRQRAKETKE